MPYCPNNTEKSYSVYQFLFPNNKKYIGMTKKDPKIRLNEHLWKSRRKNPKNPVSFAIRHFNEVFDFSVLEQGLTHGEAIILERFYIKTNKTQITDFGYNVTEGGDGGDMGEEARKRWKVSVKKTMNSVQYKEKRSRMSKKMIAKDPTVLKKLQDGKVKWFSDPKNAKAMSELRSKNFLKTDVKKKAASSQNAIPYICIETGKIFFTLHEGAEYSGCPDQKGGVHACLKKKRGSYRSLHFRYLSENEQIEIKDGREFLYTVDEKIIKAATERAKTRRRPNGGTKGRRIICIDTGEIFESALVLSKKLKLRKACVYNHLKGRSKTLGGGRYKYATSEENLTNDTDTL